MKNCPLAKRTWKAFHFTSISVAFPFLENEDEDGDAYFKKNEHRACLLIKGSTKAAVIIRGPVQNFSNLCEVQPSSPSYLLKNIYLIIYLAVLGLSCGMQDL